MGLKEELGLKKGFQKDHEGLLGIYFTGQLISKRAREFFSEYGITEVQFNLISLVYHQSEGEAGLTQGELSSMMLVNRSNMTGLIDRMEKAGFVRRREVPGDRRSNAVVLTPAGVRIHRELEEVYKAEVARIMRNLNQADLNRLIELLDSIRVTLR